jgi:hypothetical protein
MDCRLQFVQKKMKKTIVYTLLILSCTFHLSCSKEQLDDCITSTGPERTETRLLEYFNTIEINGFTDVYITRDLSKPLSVTVTTGRNLMGQFITDVDNGTLFIDNQNVCNWVRRFNQRVKVVLNVHDLALVRTTEDAAITGSDLLFLDAAKFINESSNNMYLNVNAKHISLISKLQGDISVDGRADVLVAYCENFGKMNLQGCRGDFVFVTHHGRNDIKVYAFKLLEVYLYNSGNVYYLYQQPIEGIRLARFGTGYLYKK